ncbi:MAG: glutamate mutase L [Chloroflexi bacterium]|nr:glutamate mutase L [Chloroflexota bacterium]
MSMPQVESIIAADIGSTLTKAVLIDVVEGDYRIIARAEFPTTAEPPWSDVALALQQCIGRLEEIAGRQMLDDSGALLLPEHVDGSGVDAFVASASAAEPLRVAVTGLMPGASSARNNITEAARRAAYTTYALPTDPPPTKSKRLDLAARINALHQQAPSVIIVAGDGARAAKAQPSLIEAAHAVAMACLTWPDTTRPDVIFSGDERARAHVAEIVGDGVNLHSTGGLQRDARPAPDDSLPSLESTLEAIFVERRLNRLPQIGKLAAMANLPIAATAAAFGVSVQAIARHFNFRTLGVDVGGATTSLALHDAAQFHRVVRSDLGVSHNIERVARAAGIANVLRWLPQSLSEDEAWDRLANKAARPYTLPGDHKDLWLEQAIAREAIRLTLSELLKRWRPGKARLYPELLPVLDLIIGTGGVLNHVPLSALNALILLDALQPVGVVNLAQDAGGVLPVLSLVAGVGPQVAAELTAHEGIVSLGTAICPVSSAKPGEVILAYQLTYAGANPSTVTGEVKAGEIELLPLGINDKAELVVHPAGNTDVGLKRRGRSAVAQVEGGLVGVIIDARGRPLALPDDPAQREALNRTWLSSMGAASFDSYD